MSMLRRDAIPFVPVANNKVSTDDKVETEYKPSGGWNPVFSQKDRQLCTEYYRYIEPIHGPIIAEMMSQMIMYKKKYHLSYSDEQEEKLARVFR